MIKTFGAPWARTRQTLILLMLISLAAALAMPAPAAEPDGQEARFEVRFLVLDTHDRPVAGAVIRFTPKAGAPTGKTPLATGPDGRAQITWQPQSRDLTKGLQTKDRITGLETDFTYRVEAKGYAPALGQVKHATRAVTMSDETFAKLERQADLRPIQETVLLRPMSEMLDGELAGAGASSPVARRCLAFHQANAEVAMQLGAPFAWPAFRLKKGVLAVRFDWHPGGALVESGRNEVAQRMARDSGLPLAIVAGQELLPLKGVRTLNLEITAELTPPDDPHALPQRKVLIISAPAKDYQALAKGSLNPDGFLARHQPRLLNLD